MFAMALRTWSGLHGIGRALVLLAVGLAVAGSVWLAGPLVSRTTIDEAPPRADGTTTPLASGAFTRVDALHAGEGVAAISRDADGQLVLRLEGFSVTNGPDLFVALSGHPRHGLAMRPTLTATSSSRA